MEIQLAARLNARLAEQRKTASVWPFVEHPITKSQFPSQKREQNFVIQIEFHNGIAQQL